MKKKSKYEFIKDKRRVKVFYRNVYSHLIIDFLFIAIQILIIGLFVFRLEKSIEVYLGISLGLSAGFMIFIVNQKGRNEFKLAWIVPMIFLPLLSIAAYIMYHTNLGSRNYGKKLSVLRKKCQEMEAPKEEASLQDVASLQEKASLQEVPSSKRMPSPQFLPTPDKSFSDLQLYLTNNFFLPYENCQTKYYLNGESFFPELIKEIQNAQKYIFLDFFIVELDASWNEILDALEERAKSGVEIRLICDGLGSPVVSTRLYQKYLKSKGIKSRVFIPIVPIFSTHLNHRDHRKIIIIDGNTAFTGGLNLANEYFNRGKNKFAYWKDNAVKIQGPAIHTLLQLFLQSWNMFSKTPEDFSPYFPVCNQTFTEAGTIIPYGDDFFNNKDIAENIYLYIINNAKKYLNITTPYILVDNLLQEALFFAAARGVDVSIILPSRPDHFLTFCIGKTFLNTFVKNGIKVYLYKKGFIHQKTFIADDKIATIGSVNLDYRSLYHHFENGVIFIDSPIVNAVKNDFDNILKDCTLMEQKDYKKIPLHIRAIGRVLRIFAPLF